MKMRADYNHATGRWEITDTDAIPPSTFAEVSDEARAKLLANAANNFAPMLAALEKAEQGARQLCKTVNSLSRQLGLGVKVREEDFAEPIRAAVRAAKEGA